MNRVSHFEIHAEDPERAAAFYRDVFGWEIKKWEGDLATSGGIEYWMVMTAPADSKEAGINGGIIRREGSSPEKGACPGAFVCTVVVASYDETAAKIESCGGECQKPKYALAGMAWQGYFTDTEGNLFGVHQSDKDAK